MQNWKIKRMSVKVLEKWLDSVDKLLLHYLGAEGIEMFTCPLCWAACKECLWTLIEGRKCGNFRNELYPERDPPGVSTLRRYPKIKKYTKWRKARIKQLECWRCIISHELAGRYVKRRKDERTQNPIGKIKAKS